MSFKPAHKDTETPAGQFRYNKWWKKYNSVNGCPPASVVGEAAYRQGWADAIKNYEERQLKERVRTRGYGA